MEGGLDLILPTINMKIGLSVAASNRMFGKAMARIRPRLKPLLEGFPQAVPSRASCEGILVGLTDGKSDDYFEEVENRDGYFQVLVGCLYPVDDEALIYNVYRKIVNSITSCPMDEDQLRLAVEYLEKWKGAL